jgi:glycosyltransferase involved in cell wall biosynthesis
MSPETGVAYVLKGYPRISEIFIASEIYRLEQLGLPMRLFVLKPADETTTHPVVERIRATPHYLPAMTSLSATPFYRWLPRNIRPFVGSIARVVRRRPLGLARATGHAITQSLRARKQRFGWPRKLYAKELLHGIALADGVLADPGIDHLHAHFAHGATTVTWFASTITGVPFSFTGHAKDIYSGALNPAGLLRRKLTAARFAVTCTEANRQHLLQVAPGADVRRVYHGLNADFTRLLESQSPNGARPADELRLLGVGRLVHKKGFDTLVAACGILARRGVPFRATIVGPDDEAGPGLRMAISELGVEDRVEIRGQMSQAELFDEYRHASAFCLPCRVMDDGDRDGIPNVLAEAMACGVPVVTTPISGIPELIRDGVNGLLVPSDDPAALADALERLRSTPDLVARLSAAGRESVLREFDGELLATTMKKLFATGADA